MQSNGNHTKASQVGGNHYTKLKIQPLEYAMENNLNPCQAKIVKYITRYKDKGGVEDLKKAAHVLAWLIEWESGDGKEDTGLQTLSSMD